MRLLTTFFTCNTRLKGTLTTEDCFHLLNLIIYHRDNPDGSHFHPPLQNVYYFAFPTCITSKDRCVQEMLASAKILYPITFQVCMRKLVQLLSKYPKKQVTSISAEINEVRSFNSLHKQSMKLHRIWLLGFLITSILLERSGLSLHTHWVGVHVPSNHKTKFLVLHQSKYALSFQGITSYLLN